VIRTRVGYAGGTKKNPTYYSLGDHTETIQIDYDPAVISYRELLDIFWDSHAPIRPAWSRQYMSIIFFHSDEQKRVALESRDHEEAKRGGRIFTEIIPFSKFYLAEAYHQKYLLQGEPDLMREFSHIYQDGTDFVNSTAAARVNGYLGGNGTLPALKAELAALGLSEAGSKRLVDIVSKRKH
jgi:methionine-S-sulfoxide reductase